jgi:putative ABC transport system permease protein
MIRNYIKIAWRNLTKNKFSSLINIGGLAVGMGVAMLIGLWIWGELSYNKNFAGYNRIAQVMQNQYINNYTQTGESEAYPLGNALQSSYGSNFKHIVMSTWKDAHILSFGDKSIKEDGSYMGANVVDMLSLKILKGSRAGLNDPSSIMLSQSVAKAIFGNADPINKMMKIDGKQDVKVTGVYADLSQNSSFADLTFIAPWELIVQTEHYDTRFQNPWGANWFQTFVQIADNANMDEVSARIKNVKIDQLKGNPDARLKPVIFLHPMSKWHLYSEFKNGVNAGGDIKNVWMFGLIGLFVLLLACINFMNLSTARSEKRAKEVGIRKAIGSMRSQLVVQFYSESLLTAVFAFALALVLLQMSLPFFNQLGDKHIAILWNNPLFWLCGITFTLFTGLIAGSYPALYLSSFQPVKVLKGTFRVGRLAAVPRKVLVVVQFVVSVVLIVGTIVIFQQVQFAKNRPVGYSRNGLITISLQTDEINNHYEAVRNDLIQSGAVVGVTETQAPLTNVYISNGGFKWKGKDPNLREEFTSLGITSDFGQTVNWKLKEGRDFSSSFKSDSSGFIVNEAGVKFMGLKNPVGETLEWVGNGNFKIIGVVKDMVTRSPYEPIRQMFFYLRRAKLNNVVIRINPHMSANEAITKIGSIFKRYDSTTPFDYRFVDDQYAKKFDNEERIGKLATCFAGLAIFLSCLGLFGMASFMAEQRIKEIGVRKVLGASVFNLWRLLSSDFVLLVIISLVIATPIAYYLMHGWLQSYEYRASMSWWVFAITGAGALIITLLTVSYQSIRAALANPISSLKTE